LKLQSILKLKTNGTHADCGCSKIQSALIREQIVLLFFTDRFPSVEVGRGREEEKTPHL